MNKISIDFTGLENVAKNASIVQSSLSRWSVKDEGKAFISEVSCKDFAFHTDYEENPWVKLDLQHNYFPDFIVIENRKREPFDSIAYGLIVECSCDDVHYELLHSGYFAFGSFSGSVVPMVIPLNKTKELKFIKLSLLSSDKKSPLHLSSIKVLCEGGPSLGKSLGFVSSRTDGFGERIKSLLNAIVLSRIYDVDYYFTWQPISDNLSQYHSIENSDKVFSKEYLNNHLIEEVPSIEDSLHIREIEKTNLDLGRFFLVDQNPIIRSMPSLKNILEPNHFITAFEEIDFSAELRSAVDIAKSVNLGKRSIAIHVRSGDIVHGQYRHGDRYTNKVIPLYLLDVIISNCLVDYDEIVIFGQDASVCRSFSSMSDKVFYSDDLISGLESCNLQKALFDVVLMSRCSSIISGTSGFAQLSAIISGQKNIDPIDFISDKINIFNRGSDFLKDNERNYSSLDIAFSYWHLFHNYSNQIKLDDSAFLLKIATEKDPDNFFYKVIYSIFLHKVGLYEESKIQLDFVLKSKKHRFGIRHLVTKYPDGKAIIYKYLGFLRDMSCHNTVARQSALEVLEFYESKK